MKNKKFRLTMITIVIMALVVIFTSKIGTVVNSNYVEFKDGTGYYTDDSSYTGKYKIFLCIDIIDLFNNEI